jgi:phosphatidylglycerophosphate synthase
MTTITGRRELATRQTAWAKWLAAALRRCGVRPNGVSVASVGCAMAATTAFVAAPYASERARPLLFVAAAAAIQLRLLCNLLDGMLAVEEGLQTPTGHLFNEIPDRVADVVILAGAGYSVPQVAGGALLGWTAAAAALFTAYVRLLGGSLGLPQRFAGPMAKQHRMFVLTVASLAAAYETAWELPSIAVPFALVIIAGGAAITAWRRTVLVARDLEAR